MSPFRTFPLRFRITHHNIISIISDNKAQDNSRSNICPMQSLSLEIQPIKVVPYNYTDELTSTPNQSESCSAFFCRRVFPAFVTNKAGRRNFPFESVNNLNASAAFGSSFFPLTMTPSISKRNPKLAACR